MTQRRNAGNRSVRTLLATVVAALALTTTVTAGGGPENVALVVNSSSWASQTVANHFIALRKIPDINVVYVPWNRGIDIIPGNDFREKILVPVLDTLERRGLMGQIDYVVYSSDFPFAVDLAEDFARYKISDPSLAIPVCSINSATYLWNLILARQPIIVDVRANRYMRAFIDRKTQLASSGFRSWYGWGQQAGERIEAGGQPYMLSTMLAVTSGRGNSVREALNYLTRSASSDGTHPKGTVYFSKTEDVRSKTRAMMFDDAIKDLKELGVRGQVITTALPNNKKDVLGAMIGINEYSWAKSRSTILPGAICENFTSYGGIVTEGASQTPLTELLRYGAAGSSGTVVEPKSIAEKFPSPQIHVHYARGCTLAESFYQSVFTPYQLLIVGDPLCRPWANIPTVTLPAVKPGANISGTVVLKPEVKFPGEGKLDHWELFLDGRRIGSARAGDSLPWDSTTTPDGYHELRAVAIEAGPIETQGRAVVGVNVENKRRTLEVVTNPSKRVRWDEALKVRLKSAGAQRILLLQNGRGVGQVAGADGETTVNARQLGLGPVELQAVALLGNGATDRVTSVPISLTVDPPKPLPALKDVPSKLSAGLLLQLPNKKVVVVQQTFDYSWPSVAGLRTDEAFVVQGFFDVPADDVYQFQLWHFGELKLVVDGTTLYAGKEGDFTAKYAPVNLQAGHHRVTISGTTGRDVKLRVLFGGPGALSLNGSRFKHQAK